MIVTKKIIKYQIPFDSNGNMVGYMHDRDIVKWRDPETFFDALSFSRFERGRSAALLLEGDEGRHAILEGNGGGNEPQGQVFQVFLTDLSKMIPHMRDGIIEGTFTFCKRGQNFGIKLVKTRIS